MDFITRYSSLNPAQKQAVDTIEGPVMVIAGPGTGKTELLGMRVANILRSTDILPENILCLTFTDSGAVAMRERLTRIIGPGAYKIAIHTFHSFGSDIISHYGQFFYQGAHFRPSDELSSYELLRTIFEELPYSNALASTMNGEFTHLSDTLSTISELKKSGLLPDELLSVLDANDHVIETVEPILAGIFSPRISKATVGSAYAQVEVIRASGGDVAVTAIPPLARVLSDSLAAAISEAEGTNSTKPMTQWKSNFMQKNEKGELVLKSRATQAKLRAVSSIYEQYLLRMQEAELYDFDDMILRVVHAMEIFSELRFNLQEKYQYIMVDEFQDTNLAQMRILYDLASSEANNGQPNLLVVGDDDQAIYSFQGADVGNISAFRDIFPSAPLISLTDNYRSTSEILSKAQSVITIDTNRLENRVPELNKTLKSHSTSRDIAVRLAELPTISHERQWLVQQIAATIKAGTQPSSIAVLARRHHEIIALLPYFAQAGMRVNYERRDNVLDLVIINLVEHIAQIFIALAESRHEDANSLLPELLAHPAFHTDPQTIWKLSIQAHSNHQSWMEIMAVTPELIDIHSWLITQAAASTHAPLEQMLDVIIGNNQASEGFVSPLYDYFFSPEQLELAPDKYLIYLEALRTIRSKLREYRPEESPTLGGFLEFISLHRRRGSTITSIRSSASQLDTAVHLMTAHKSKGREFDTVYIIGAVDTAWGERVRTRSRLINYPDNLPLATVGDTFEERLRLFFVAMTRAKSRLIISYSESDDNGKNTERASFLAGDDWQPEIIAVDSTLETEIKSAELNWYAHVAEPIHPEMRELLMPMLDNYKLSATHLGSFLDVTRGGPQGFLINNLLRFPQSISPSAAYGSAVHAALQRAHAHLSATGSLRPVEDVLRDFEENLEQSHLREADFQSFLQKGSDTLTAFLAVKYQDFHIGQKAELNFAGQGVFIGEAHLTGSLDLVEIIDEQIIVIDYKTGRPSLSWQGKVDYEKIKLHKYKQQLMFYDLLIGNSRDYSKYKVAERVIQFVEPSPSGDIVSLNAEFTPEEFEHFKQLVCAVWEHITTLTLPDTTSFEPSYKGILAFEAALLNH